MAAMVWTGEEILVWGGTTWRHKTVSLHDDGVAVMP
jgi:hypothetical protein